MRKVLLAALVLLTGMPLLAQTPRTDFCETGSSANAPNLFCKVILATVPDIIANGTRQVIPVTQVGALNHQVTWASTSTAASGATVTVSATTDGVNWSTQNTSTSPSGSYFFNGNFSFIGVAMAVSNASMNAVYIGFPESSSNISFNKTVAGTCTGQTVLAKFDTKQVVTGGGSAVTATTSCILGGYINNITNSAVTVRLQDGNSVIWLGGNADFSIPANSNFGLAPLIGTVFTSGITAIAGTGSALNLHIDTLQ